MENWLTSKVRFTKASGSTQNTWAHDTYLIITTEASIESKTGVEMEALTAASVAALTVYDMCKGIDKGMVINATKLLNKTGGKSGDWSAGA